VECGKSNCAARGSRYKMHGKLLQLLLTRNPIPAPRNTKHEKRKTKHKSTNLYKFRKVVDNNGFFMVYI
jgi:hypothetical protein